MQSELWQVYKQSAETTDPKTRPKTTQPKLPTAGSLCLMNMLHPLSSVKAVTWSLLPRRATEHIAASLILNIAISEPLLTT